MATPNEKSRGDHHLKHAIDDGSFFTLSTDAALRLIQSEYAAELDRLKTAYSIPGNRESYAHPPSPSKQLYGADFDEINRTLVGILSLRWIYVRDYRSFVGCQPLKYRLSQASFDWICQLFEDGLKNADDIYLLITSMVINDLGKSPTLATDYQHITQACISRENHDMILYRVMKEQPRLIPSLLQLSAEDFQDLLLRAELQSEFNIGQLIQAENAPVSLSGLRMMKGNKRAFNLWFMEHLIDLAGALGHVDHTCAKILTEPICESHQRAFVICSDIMNGDIDTRQGYDMNLKGKVHRLVQNGWGKGHELDICKVEHRALMRLLCMSNVLEALDADLVYNAFYAVSDGVRHSLIHDLNVDGSPERPAVQPTYIPAMCATAIRCTQMNSGTEKLNALTAVFCYLARTMRLDMSQVQSMFPKGVVVIERDVRKVLLQHVKSKEFLDNPEMLDHVDIPQGEIAKTADGYQ